LTTGDPAAPTPQWTTTNVDGDSVMWDVSCPTTSLCVAGDETGSILTTSAVPTVSAVSPQSGPAAGGTAVTITGTGFVTGATVVIGQGSGAGPTAIAATNVTVVSQTKITAVTGGGAKTGTWSLYVITSGGTSAATFGSNFTYH